MASAIEVELGWLFENYQKATYMWTSLEEMVHPQPTTPVTTENIAEIASWMERQKKRSIAIDMIFYWVRNIIRKIISTYSGKKERKTWRVMSQNTTWFVTTELCNQDIWNQKNT